MKLTKRGFSALERAELSEEGKDDSFAFSPYKKAKAYWKCKLEINQLHESQKKAGAKSYTPRSLTRDLNIYISYFNTRGAEFDCLTK